MFAFPNHHPIHRPHEVVIALGLALGAMTGGSCRAAEVVIDTDAMLIDGSTFLDGVAFSAVRQGAETVEFRFRDNLQIIPGTQFRVTGSYGAVLYGAQNVTVAAGVSFNLSAVGTAAGSGGGRGGYASPAGWGGVGGWYGGGGWPGYGACCTPPFQPYPSGGTGGEGSGGHWGANGDMGGWGGMGQLGIRAVVGSGGAGGQGGAPGDGGSPGAPGGAGAGGPGGIFVPRGANGQNGGEGGYGLGGGYGSSGLAGNNSVIGLTLPVESVSHS